MPTFIGTLPRPSGSRQAFLVVRLSGSAVRRHIETVRQESSAGRNVALLIPGMSAELVADGPVTLASIELPRKLLDDASETLGQPPLSARLREDLCFHGDQHLDMLAGEYARRASDTTVVPTALEMDARAMLLVDHLHRLHDARRSTPRPAGGLAPWQLRRVCDYMMVHLDDDTRLSTLAASIGLGARHFARAFRRSTGLPPHQWLIARRIDRAKEVLAEADIGLAEAAITCGFADQSHFTACFRRATGVTPGVWRREHLV